MPEFPHKALGGTVSAETARAESASEMGEAPDDKAKLATARAHV
jgi:hypothetical protein